MCYLNSASDDTPEPCSRAPRLPVTRLRRERDDIVTLTADVLRMVERQRAGDASFTGVGCRVTIAQTRNALEGFLQSLKEVEGEVLPSRGISTGYPVVASVGGL